MISKKMKNTKISLILGMFVAFMILLGSQLASALQPNSNPPASDVNPNFSSLSVSNSLTVNGTDSQINSRFVNFALQNNGQKGYFQVADPYSGQTNLGSPIFSVGDIFEIKGGVGAGSFVNIERVIKNLGVFEGGKVVIDDPQGVEIRGGSLDVTSGGLNIGGKFGRMIRVVQDITVSPNSRRYDYVYCPETDDIVLDCGYWNGSATSQYADIAQAYIPTGSYAYKCYYSARNNSATDAAFQLITTCLDLD